MYYKTIGKDNQSCNGGDFDWSDYLPTKNGDEWVPGKWTPIIENVVLCESGYHVVDSNHLVDWIEDQCYEVEVIGQEQGDGKYVCQSIRLIRKIEEWNDTNLRLFACWCVRQVWELLADESKKAVEVAEKYAIGEATGEELAAARNAAGAAAGAAARNAARNAAVAAGNAAWAAAGYAARNAARNAAGAAAGDAAGYVEWDAAWYAAGAAAGAAAGDAAWYAEWDAAWYAAWYAVRALQNKKLVEMIGLGD